MTPAAHGLDPGLAGGRDLFTSESVTEGHPDKFCDALSDRVLDAYLDQDPGARVACECLVKGRRVIVAGEVTADVDEAVDPEAIARKLVREIGYTDPDEEFSPGRLEVHTWLTEQAGEIAAGVDAARDEPDTLGAGDQGMMFGYATDETLELMPLPILLAHRLTAGLAADRRAGTVDWLRPDGKSQVTVAYDGGRPVEVTDVVVSCQHRQEADADEIEAYVREALAPRALGDWHREGIRFRVNPSGSFVHGGPSADCGLTGRKLFVDTYGGMARHGGGAFSGKDPSKVDRSAAYFGRWVARRIIQAGLAARAELQVAYAIGEARPVSLRVTTFGTGDDREARDWVRKEFDFRPAAIIDRLDLRRPIYGGTTNYGHFGRPGLSWEE